MKRFAMAALLASLGSIASAQSLAGLWDATVDVEGTQIPFRLGQAAWSHMCPIHPLRSLS